MAKQIKTITSYRIPDLSAEEYSELRSSIHVRTMSPDLIAKLFTKEDAMLAMNIDEESFDSQFPTNQ